MCSTLHLFSCQQDRKWICEILHLSNSLAFPAPLIFNYWGSLQDWLFPSNSKRSRRLTTWLKKLKEATQKADKVVIWYSHDIQSKLFLELMCHVVDADLHGVDVGSRLNHEKYIQRYLVHYFKQPIETFCSNICCISKEDIIAADCLNNIHWISGPRKAKLAKHFEHLAAKDKGFRVARHGGIINVKSDFYDKSLILPIYNEILTETGRDVRAARLIGTCMADLPFEEEVCYISYFFYLRLEYLQKLGKMPKLVDMEKKNFKQF